MESIALGCDAVSLRVAGVLSANHIIFLTFVKWRGLAKTLWTKEGFKNITCRKTISSLIGPLRGLKHTWK